MKYLIFFLAISPYFTTAQDLQSAFNLSGGAELHESQTHAWNVELSYQNRISNTKRFWTEFGVNYSIREYKGDSDYKLDTSTLGSQVSYGPIDYPEYTRFQSTHYSRSTFLRFQAGVNFTIVDQEKFKVSAGVNLVSQLLLNHKEHGQRVYIPFSDTLAAIDLHYYVDSSTKEVTLAVQPHLNASYLLLDDLWLTARVSSYDKLFDRENVLRAQMNLGLRYYL
ncbi:MAG: hypothetical protein HWE22_10695 [Flavobacteriales bacterium]|nr:hypothetical protein [Flavobacteriales bacterium]